MKNLNTMGAVLLSGVLVMSAVSVVIGISLVLGGVARTQSSGVARENIEARIFAETCVDQALDDIRSNPGGSLGATNYSNGSISCTYEILTSTGPIVRVINADAVSGSVTFRVRVELSSIDPSLRIESWSEVESF